MVLDAGVKGTPLFTPPDHVKVSAPEADRVSTAPGQTVVFVTLVVMVGVGITEIVMAAVFEHIPLIAVHV
jgi:hypothetical protein